MSRSKWKGPYTNIEYFYSSEEKKLHSNLIIANRNSGIIPKFVGQTFQVHNGKKYSEITVTEDMVSHKFGEFVFTRGKFLFKKKKSKK